MQKMNIIRILNNIQHCEYESCCLHGIIIVEMMHCRTEGGLRYPGYLCAGLNHRKTVSR